MANSLHSDSTLSYSWWWDSHINPKNSKWLQDNLADIDGKVKSMIKIINEDADSFARRAEMYYKKRPELMKLVEEFYRAYRALAERYDHATGELRLAHRTMIEAFPNQVSCMPGDDKLQPSAIFHPADSNRDSDARLCKNGLKDLNEIFQTGEAILKELKTAEERLREGNLQNQKDKDSSSKRRSSLSSDKNQNLDLTTMILNQSEQAAKAEAEMRRLKQKVAQMEAERDSTLVQYQKSLEKLINLETELISAQADAEELDKHVSEAEIEVKTLKESILKLEAERDCSLIHFKEASKRLASLEAMATATQEDITQWSERAVKAENKSQNLKQELSRSEIEKQSALAQYQESLGKISVLEEKLRLADENAKRLCEQNERAECEVKTLKEELSKFHKEKDDAYLRYQQYLAMISELQNELIEAKEEVQRLKSEILLGSEKLKGSEEYCASLEIMNQSLQLEADDLVQEIAAKDRQLSEKQTELEKLMNGLQDEQSHFMVVEGNLHTLQNLHIQSQEEHRCLALELTNWLQMFRGLEICKQDLELEIDGLREENQGLNDLRLAFSVAEKDMQHGIKSLKEIKEKLEAKVKQQAEQNEVLQKQFDQLKEEIAELYRKYQDLQQQVESAGIDPKCFMSSIKSLQEENSQLKQVTSEGKLENEGLLRRLQDMEGLLQKSSMLERSFTEVKVELECSKEKMKAMQEYINALSGEKSVVVDEKTVLFPQLKIITDSMQKLLENNVTLEKSLQGANIELEGLRVKSKGLEEFCQYLKDEKSNLVAERSSLAYQLECVEKRLVDFETKFTKLEDKYAGLEKERNLTHNKVEELRISLDFEKKEHKCLVLTNEARLLGLDEHINHLQEENKYRKKDFEEQLEKAVNAQVEIFILQKFMKEMEEKQYNLLAECRKHEEAVKYSEDIISELESENMMQHLEAEYLLDRVDKLRRGICQVLKALEIDHVSDGDPEIFLPRVRGKIKDIGRSLSDREDENQKLLIQNSVLSAVIIQLSSDAQELTSQKEAVDQELSLLKQQHVILVNEKNEILERSTQLDRVVDEKDRGQETLRAQMDDLNLKQETVTKQYVLLQQDHSDLLKANCFLQEKLSSLEEEKHKLEEENSGNLSEALSFNYQSAAFKCSLVQTVLEAEAVVHDMCRLQEEYNDLENEARSLEGKLTSKEIENVQLRDLIQQLEVKNKELNACNNWLYEKCSAETERYNQKEAEHDEAEQITRATQAMNTELHTTIEGLQVRYKDASECTEHQEKEIVLLKEANGGLESDMIVLFEEFEACRIREVVLSSELHDRSSEFELWEAEAASFYFDLQISSVREALLESKVHEISGLYEDLEDVNSRRSMEIDEMKNKISLLETERDDLKCKMAAYPAAIASIKDNIASLEQTSVLQTKSPYPSTKKQQVLESKKLDISDCTLVIAREQTSSLPDGLSELQDLQSRIKAIESMLIVEDLSQQQCVNAKVNIEAAKKGTEKLKSITNSRPDIMIHDVKRRPKNLHGNSIDLGLRTLKVRNKSNMKDIPLDHVSDASFSSSRRRRSGRLSDEIFELQESSEPDYFLNLIPSKSKPRTSPPRSEDSPHIELEIGELTEFYPGEIERELGVDELEVSKNLSQPKNGGNRKAILERLASEAQKLVSLQISVQELKQRNETNKKSKATKDFEYRRLNGQLQEVENSVLQLVDMNSEAAKTIKEISSSSGSMDPTEPVEVEKVNPSMNILEQTRKHSKKIESLQLEMQRIEYFLLKLDDEKISTNSLVKSGFSKMRTGIILREFVYNHGRRSRKNKNSRFCGCFRPSHKEVRGN